MVYAQKQPIVSPNHPLPEHTISKSYLDFGPGEDATDRLKNSSRLCVNYSIL